MKYRQQGYIVLLLSIIVTTVGVFLALNAAVVSSQAGKNNLAIQQSQKAESIARRCTELVFQKLQENRYYEGDESLDFPNGDECYVYALSGRGNGPRTIITSARDTNTTRYLETKLSSVAPRIQIESQTLIVNIEESTDTEIQNVATNSPSQVQSNSLALWLRPSTVNVHNGASIAAWPDTWNDLTLTQADVANQPLMRLRFANGRPGVELISSEVFNDPPVSTALSIPGRTVLGVVEFAGSSPELITTEAGWDSSWTEVSDVDLFGLSSNGVILELMIYEDTLTSESQLSLQTYLTTKYDL